MFLVSQDNLAIVQLYKYQEKDVGQYYPPELSDEWKDVENAVLDQLRYRKGLISIILYNPEQSHIVDPYDPSLQYLIVKQILPVLLREKRVRLRGLR